jgi:hypothetical protein
LMFWEGTLPNVVGNSAFKLETLTKQVVSPNGWYTVGNAYVVSQPTAVMGNVGYPISISILEGKVTSDGEKAALGIVKRIKPVILFDIGKLDVTASREELSYDESTIRNLIERCSEVVEEFLLKFKNDLNTLVNKQQTELEFRTAAHALISSYTTSYGHDFVSFYKSRMPSVVRKGKTYTLEFLSTANVQLFTPGVCEVAFMRITSRSNRHGLERFKKEPFGNVIAVDSVLKPTIESMTEILDRNHYRQVKTTQWWNPNKAALPRRMKSALQDYEAYVKGNQNTKYVTFTGWTFSNFIVKPNTFTFLVNDMGTHGDRIIQQYIIENGNQYVYVLEYNKRKVNPAYVTKLTNSLAAQMEGIKFISVAQLKLTKPVVRTRSVAPTVSRTIDEVTFFTNTGTMLQSTQLKDFIYTGNYGQQNQLKWTRVYDGGISKEVDFTTGDFYYFYELRNKMYLDAAFTRRVDPSNYLNALVAYGIVKPGTNVVGLRPAQVKKLTSSKIKGKMIPVSTLDQQLEQSVKSDTRLLTIMKISYAGGIKSGSSIQTLLSDSDMITHLRDEYGFDGKPGSKYKLLADLTPVINVLSTLYDVELRKKATILEMIRYYPESADKYYKDALVMFVNRDKDTAEVEKLQKQLATISNNVLVNYPVLRYVNLDFRYSSNRVKESKEALKVLIDYAQAVK